VGSARHEERLQAEIGRRIRAARESADFTQEEAADASGIDLRRWQRLENGEANPTVRTLDRIATACGSDFWTLLRPS
jgi:transcriptional regulator with XRE-family HTH domain